jgi:hypothetical protein
MNDDINCFQERPFVDSRTKQKMAEWAPVTKYTVSKKLGIISRLMGELCATCLLFNDCFIPCSRLFLQTGQ